MPLVLLALPSVIIGFYTIDPMLFGDFFKDAIYVDAERHHVMEELGHAYHTWVMRDEPGLLRDYPMNLAETASTFAEAVLGENRLAACRTRDEKLDLLDKMLGEREDQKLREAAEQVKQAIQDRIASEKTKLFGDNSAMAQKISEFEQLTLQRDIADRTLAESMSALESARQDARRQHVYVEEVVSPGLPDWPTEP